MKRNDVGFTLVELLCVLVILALLALIVGRMVTKSLSSAKDDLDDSKRKSILNAAEKWSINNLDKFDDADSKKIKVGLDVVFIVDMSGGMNEGIDRNDLNSITKSKSSGEAMNVALDILRQNELNRVGFILFSGRPATKDASGFYRNASQSILYESTSLIDISDVQNVSSTDSSITIQGETINFSGSTYTMLSIQKATSLLMKSGEKGRIPVIILLTDGEPSVGIGTYEMDKYDFVPKNADHGTGTTWCLSDKTWDAGNGIDPDTNALIQSWSYGYCNGLRTILGESKNGATDRSVMMIWNVMKVATGAKEKISESYQGAPMYFYTIGLGLTSDFGKFMLDPLGEASPGVSRLEALKDSYDNQMPYVKATLYKEGGAIKTHTKTYNYYDTLWHVDISEKLYSFIKTKNVKDYNYVTKSFLNSDSLDDLKKNFEEIATEISEATKVSEVCVKVKDLQKDGYLSEKIELTEEWLDDNYVIMSYNEPTNQFSYAIAETDSQIQACKDYYIAQEQKKMNKTKSLIP